LRGIFITVNSVKYQ